MRATVRQWGWWALVALVAVVLGAPSAAAQGLYYKEIRKDGRIYVFNNAEQAARFAIASFIQGSRCQTCWITKQGPRHLDPGLIRELIITKTETSSKSFSSVAILVGTTGSQLPSNSAMTIKVRCKTCARQHARSARLGDGSA